MHPQISEGIGWLHDLSRWNVSPWVQNMNRALGRLHSPIDLRRRFDHREDMVSVEQAANFELLITELLERDVPGDFVELGCYTGSSASIFAGLLDRHAPERSLHVYDRFDMELGSAKRIRARFEEKMHNASVFMPVIHEGDIHDLVPDELPDRIAFAHIDLGTGGLMDSHVSLMVHALSAVYERLSPAGLLVLMDYHIQGLTVHGNDSNPGVRIATDAFLEDKPEKIRLLYGGPCSHAYVRKTGTP